MTSMTLAFDILARDKASRTFNDVGDAADRSGGKLAKFGSAAVAGAAVAASGLAVAGAAAWKVIGSASDLNETMNKASVIFGQNSAAMEKWASGAAKSSGLSKQAALDAAAGFGDMFTQIGFGSAKAAKMSRDVIQMSADLGSFSNLDTADVSDRIAAAFRGEYDSLQAVIPNINAARVESEALAATGKKTAKELTAQEKAAAVLAIVHKDGARAMGDFARTSDSLANRQKTLSAMFENTKASLGEKLLPVATEVAGFLVDDLGPAAQKAGDWFKTNVLPPLKDFGEAIAPKVKDLMEKIKTAFKDAQPFFELVGNYFTNVMIPMWKKVAEVALPVLGTAISAIGKAFGLVGTAFTATWNNVLQPVLRFLLNSVGNVSSGFATLLRGLGNVPGFEWADRAATKLDNAARKAHDLADGISKIERDVDVRVAIQTLGAVPGPAALAAAALATANRGKKGGQARGTNFWSGGFTWVGEEGPEIIEMPRGTRVHTANRSRQLAEQSSGGTGGTREYHFHGIQDVRLMALAATRAEQFAGA